MKKILIIVESVFFALLLLGCTEVLIPGGMSDEALSGGTKGPTELYCWYHGEQIPLTLNQDYVNILLDTAVVKGADVSTLCTELGLAAKSELNKDGLFKAALRQPKDYHRIVEALRSDVRIRKVLPFYDFEEREEPVGSSHIFYVQLKELFPEKKQESETIPYLEKEFDVDALHQEIERLGVRIVREVAYMPDWYVISIEDSAFETAIEAANLIYESGRFKEIDPGFMFEAKPCVVNDPMFDQQWGLKNITYPDYDINVEDAWDFSTGNNVKVAVIDSNIDPNHNDLSANISLSSFNVSNGLPCNDFIWDAHGTHVAGIIGAVGNNNLQMAGVAYNTKIMRVQVVYGSGGSTSEQYASGISWAWQHGADVINCSWIFNGASSILGSAISTALTEGRLGKGTVVVFASGNEYSSTVAYPASSDDRILVVGAIDSTGIRPSFSNYGSKLDVVAPGVDILSTYPNNMTQKEDGTSMAAPHVSGVAALMLSANPNLKREEVVRTIELTANRISPGNNYTYGQCQGRENGPWNAEMGYGLVDATRSVLVAYYAGSTPPPGSPSLSFYVSSGVGAVYSDGIVMGVFPSAMVSFFLPNEQINPSYTYCWSYTTTGDPYWSPTYSYIGNNPAVNVTIPKPSSNSVLRMRCEVFNGSTHVCSAYLNFDVWPDFP